MYLFIFTLLVYIQLTSCFIWPQVWFSNPEIIMSKFIYFNSIIKSETEEDLQGNSQWSTNLGSQALTK